MNEYWSSGSSFEMQAGYVRARRCGDHVFVAGTTGFNYDEMSIPNELDAQVHQAVQNIGVALGHVDATLGDVVRINWIITDRAYFFPAGEILKSYFETARPVMTTLVCALIDARMKFEIEVTAMINTNRLPSIRLPGGEI